MIPDPYAAQSCPLRADTSAMLTEGTAAPIATRQTIVEVRGRRAERGPPLRRNLSLRKGESLSDHVLSQ